MRLECDFCGTPFYDLEQEQQLIQYDRTYSQAMSHIAVGNWEEAVALLHPLMQQDPIDKRIYLAVLRALTQNFSDVDINNVSNRKSAAEAWDKLVRLNAITSEMLKYSRQCYDKHKSELDKQKRKILAWIFIAAAFSICAGLFWGTESYFIALLCIGGLIKSLSKVLSLQPGILIKQIMCDAPTYQKNPFT